MRILVTGATGFLGRWVARAAARAGNDVVAWCSTRHGAEVAIAIDGVGVGVGVTAEAVDLAGAGDGGGRAAIVRAWERARPDAVIHSAAMARVAECAADPARATAVNERATALLAELAGAAQTRLVHVSTDLVFDGENAPYAERDPARPISVYGRTKLAAEAAALGARGAVVARVALLYGPSLGGDPSFFDRQVAALRTHAPLRLFADEWRTPLAAVTAASALVAMARERASTGIVHVGGPERISRLEMGQRIARWLGAAPTSLVAAARADDGEARPRDVALDTSAWRAAHPDVAWPGFEAGLDAMRDETERAQTRLAGRT